MASYILKLKWAWQAYSLSATLLILKMYTTFKDVQMMLKIFFDTSTGFRFAKISVECYVHLCSCPWIISRINILINSWKIQWNIFCCSISWNPNTWCLLRSWLLSIAASISRNSCFFVRQKRNTWLRSDKVRMSLWSHQLSNLLKKIL